MTGVRHPSACAHRSRRRLRAAPIGRRAPDSPCAVIYSIDRVRGVVLGGYGEWSMDEWSGSWMRRRARRRDGTGGAWASRGRTSHGLILASYRRRMGVIAVREMVRGTGTASRRYTGLTRPARRSIYAIQSVGRSRGQSRTHCVPVVLCVPVVCLIGPCVCPGGLRFGQPMQFISLLEQTH